MARPKKVAGGPKPEPAVIGGISLTDVVILGNSILADWGSRITRHRGRRGLSQEELAEALGVSLMTVIRWEKGQMEPRLHHKLRLARELATDARDLFPLSGTGEAA